MKKNSKQVTLKLEIKVTYNLEGCTTGDVRGQLIHLAYFAAQHGLLSGETLPATVEDWTAKVSTV